MSATVPPAASYDAVVIGAGLAGLSAGLRAAEAGARVLVLAKGVGSTHLAPGTIDVLGYAPDRVDAPGEALPGFVRDHPDHPYGRLADGDVQRAVDWFKARFEAGLLGGYRYEGSLERNVLLPTALGVPKPSAVVPKTMLGGDLRSGGRVCIVGLRPYKDLSASFLAENLSRAGLGIEARSVEVDVRPEGRSDPTRSASPGRSRTRDRAPRWPTRWPASSSRRSAWACPRCSACTTPRPCGATSSSGSSARCLRSRRCRPRCPGSGFTAR